MNKLVTVLGVAMVATLTGCKDPNYSPMSTYSQDDVKVVPTETPKSEVKPVETVPAKPSCTCAPGTKHTKPCACGADDCRCVVVLPEAKPLPPPEPEYTTYIVQNGDYLAKISKKYNITINSIKKLNNMSSDIVRVGQKLKLPGKIDVGVQKTPAKAASAQAKVAAGAAEYKGETKEYVVKSGDTLGAIAYGNGCNIRQLKKLNNLTSDSLKVGQKLKVPAAGKAVVKAAAKETKPAVKADEPKPVTTPSPEVKEPEVEAPADTVAPVAADPAPQADATTVSYTVQETDDLTGVSIRFGISVAAIRELNGLAEDAQLTPGQTIKLPAEAQQ